jgi:predicted nucleic acid-binding protein
MRLDDALLGVRRLGIDTAPIIYLIEAHPQYEALVTEVGRRIARREIEGVTSVITLGEVLVQPFAQGSLALQAEYRDILLHSAGLRTVEISADAAEEAARLRARHGTRLPDALQVATALRTGCEAFLTNDRRLARVTELRVLLLDDLEL